MNVARLVVIDDDILHQVECYSPFHLRDIPKALPERRWSKARRCWIVPLYCVDVLADALRAAGCDVFVQDVLGRPYNGRHGRRHHGHRNQPAADWITQAFDAVPADNVAKLRRALMSAFHPDAGGDPRIATRINTVADQKENKIA